MEERVIKVVYYPRETLFCRAEDVAEEQVVEVSAGGDLYGPTTLCFNPVNGCGLGSPAGEYCRCQRAPGDRRVVRSVSGRYIVTLMSGEEPKEPYEFRRKREDRRQFIPAPGSTDGGLPVILDAVAAGECGEVDDRHDPTGVPLLLVPDSKRTGYIGV